MYLLLADDHGLFRDSMALWLKQIDEEITIDYAKNEKEVSIAISNNAYDIVILDLGMPGMQGVDSVRKFCGKLRKVPLVVVSADESPIVIRSCIAAGAAGYVTKTSDGEAMLNAIRQVLLGYQFIPLTAQGGKKDSQYDFNEKQIKLLTFLATGKSNKEIAIAMHLSEGTVKQYISRLFRMLEVDNRVQAGNIARNILGVPKSDYE